MAQGLVGQTNFGLQLTSTNVVFLAASVEDQDLDGLSDAFEHLVIGSTNTLWDTDGDGLPDGWEVAYGLSDVASKVFHAETKGFGNSR